MVTPCFRTDVFCSVVLYRHLPPGQIAPVFIELPWMPITFNTLAAKWEGQNKTPRLVVNFQNETCSTELGELRRLLRKIEHRISVVCGQPIMEEWVAGRTEEQLREVYGDRLVFRTEGATIPQKRIDPDEGSGGGGGGDVDDQKKKEKKATKGKKSTQEIEKPLLQRQQAVLPTAVFTAPVKPIIKIGRSKKDPLKIFPDNISLLIFSEDKMFFDVKQPMNSPGMHFLEFETLDFQDLEVKTVAQVFDAYHIEGAYQIRLALRHCVFRQRDQLNLW